MIRTYVGLGGQGLNSQPEKRLFKIGIRCGCLPEMGKHTKEGTSKVSKIPKDCKCWYTERRNA